MNNELDAKVKQLQKYVESSVEKITEPPRQEEPALPQTILEKDKQIKKQMKIIYQQKKEKEELRNNIYAKTVDNDPAPIVNKINKTNMEIRELEIKVNVNKGQYKILVEK